MRVAAGACVQPPDLRSVETCTKPACTNGPELRHMHSQHDTPRWDVGAWGPVCRSFFLDFFLFDTDRALLVKQLCRFLSLRKVARSPANATVKRNAFCTRTADTVSAGFYDFSARQLVEREFVTERWHASRRGMPVPRSTNPTLRKSANPRLVCAPGSSTVLLGSTRNGRPR